MGLNCKLWTSVEWMSWLRGWGGGAVSEHDERWLWWAASGEGAAGALIHGNARKKRNTRIEVPE